MAYDLEEQEQLASVKGWWHDNGTRVLIAVTLVAIAAAGWQSWRIWQSNQGQQAATQYEALLKAAQGGDAKALRDAGGTLVESYPRTLYASMGALVAARFHVERDDPKNAKVQLQWVVERSSSEELREIARLRLAAVLLDEKAYDEALALLGAKHAAPLAGQYAALKGDVLVARNQAAEARVAYRLALDKSDAKSAAFRSSVQLRLDALGG
ncbi:MAG: tetratricopeptide repeat protein [Candidatus Parcubacteria bacterium]|nr:tetratricopeptide repeat protein [Burkholderiales bacterium]